MLDDAMQAGYETDQEDEPRRRSQWRRAWEMVDALASRFGWDTVATFDEAFRGTQCLFNWIQDYAMHLEDIGAHEEIIEICEAFLQRFPSEEDRDLVEKTLATAWILSGQIAKGDELFARRVEESNCPWNWTCWAGAYCHGGESQDLDVAERILTEALQRPDLEEADAIFHNLKALYEERGKDPAELEPLRTRVQTIRRNLKDGGKSLTTKVTRTFGGEGLLLDQLDRQIEQMREEAAHAQAVTSRTVKVGRNEPCPCGSGKKHKKCCGN